MASSTLWIRVWITSEQSAAAWTSRCTMATLRCCALFTSEGLMGRGNKSIALYSPHWVIL